MRLGLGLGYCVRVKFKYFDRCDYHLCIATFSVIIVLSINENEYIIWFTIRHAGLN